MSTCSSSNILDTKICSSHRTARLLLQLQLGCILGGVFLTEYRAVSHKHMFRQFSSKCSHLLRADHTVLPGKISHVFGIVAFHHYRTAVLFCYPPLHPSIPPLCPEAERRARNHQDTEAQHLRGQTWAARLSLGRVFACFSIGRPDRQTPSTASSRTSPACTCCIFLAGVSEKNNPKTLLHRPSLQFSPCGMVVQQHSPESVKESSITSRQSKGIAV